MTSRSWDPAGKRVFARHFAEMVVVMLLGMGVLEGLAALTLRPRAAAWRISPVLSE